MKLEIIKTIVSPLVLEGESPFKSLLVVLQVLETVPNATLSWNTISYFILRGEENDPLMAISYEFTRMETYLREEFCQPNILEFTHSEGAVR